MSDDSLLPEPWQTALQDAAASMYDPPAPSLESLGVPTGPVSADDERCSHGIPARFCSAYHAPVPAGPVTPEATDDEWAIPSWRSTLVLRSPWAEDVIPPDERGPWESVDCSTPELAATVAALLNGERLRAVSPPSLPPKVQKAWDDYRAAKERGRAPFDYSREWELFGVFAAHMVAGRLDLEWCSSPGCDICAAGASTDTPTPPADPHAGLREARLRWVRASDDGVHDDDAYDGPDEFEAAQEMAQAIYDLPDTPLDRDPAPVGVPGNDRDGAT